MSASDIQILTIIVPNPLYDQSKNARIINSNLGYNLQLNTGFQTLSSNNPNSFDSIEGLLYVPTLSSPANESCTVADTFIPANVTTVLNFPPNQQYPLVAIFPWTNSADCIQAYFAQSRADAVRGVFVFQPGPAESSSSATAQIWTLPGNGGTHYISENQYPIYAISTAPGLQMLQQLSYYSGNMSNAPNGDQLAQTFDPRDFPRLFVHVDLQGGASVPSLWIFLIIVLAVLLGIVIVASVVMHFIQRRQRYVLQRRLQRGEVDLESLGIKKMNVPQEKIDEMPKYVYSDSSQPTPPNLSKSQSAILAGQPHTAAFSQTTCPICLDDFVPGETEVRELPCKHIFHPECIDLFLRDSSSLCPMCKKSALPAGYTPVKVTNLMVRRERLVRRMRERRREGIAAAAARAAGQQPLPTTPAGHVALWLRKKLRIRSTPLPLTTVIPLSTPSATGVVQANSNITSPTTQPSPTNADVETGRVNAPGPTAAPALNSNARRNTIAVPDHIASQGSAARRAWRRERLAQLQDEQYNQQAESARQADVGRPLWRRIASRVAPGFD